VPKVNIQDVLRRVERSFQNEIAEDEDSPEDARERIGRWLAAVSYDEWFALRDECDGRALLGRALELACSDMVEEGDRVETTVNAYLRGAAADLEDRDGVDHDRANELEQRAHLTLATPPEQAGAMVPMETLQASWDNNEWNVRRLQERIASLRAALADCEQILATLPRFARTEITKRALAKVQAVLGLEEVKTR
jgi:hypothetical protein